jgi:F-type H+-transporting ATPase subunit b
MNVDMHDEIEQLGDQFHALSLAKVRYYPRPRMVSTGPNGAARCLDFSKLIWYISSMLDLNSSILWVFLMVSGLFFILSRIFFKPVGRIIEEREANADADDRRLKGMVDQVDMHARSLEDQMAQARADAARIRDEWSARGAEARARALAEAKETAARVMEEKMSALEKEVIGAEKVLEKQVAVFSEKIRQAYS